jgi:hypothetical protein
LKYSLGSHCAPPQICPACVTRKGAISSGCWGLRLLRAWEREVARSVDSGASQSPPTWRIGMTAPATSTECWGRFSFRLLDAPLAMLDGWIAKQREPDMPTLSEAIRRLVELGLKGKSKG